MLEAISTGTVTHFLREYNMYKSKLSYGLEWQLSRILSPSGAEIQFSYGQKVQTFGPSKKAISLSFFNPSGVAVTKPQFEVLETYSPYDLISITSSTSRVSFSPGIIPNEVTLNNELTNDPSLIGFVTIADLSSGQRKFARQFVLSYDYIRTAGTSTYSYIFLKSVTETNGTTTLPPIQFQYIGQSIMPSLQTTRTDCFGFFNNIEDSRPQQIYVYPNITGADRFRIYPIPGVAGGIKLEGKEGKPDVSALHAGMLYGIQYPAGGSIGIDYEINQYYDEVSAADLYAGGLRVRKITKGDGLGTNNDVITRYEYTYNNRSSGKLLHKPEYVIGTEMYNNPDGTFTSYNDLISAGNTGKQLWSKLVIRSFTDLRSDDNSTSVGYEKVTLRTGEKGYREFEYLIPVMYGDQVAANWAAIKSFIARKMPNVTEGSFGTLAPVETTYSLPFGYQPIFNKEHGLLKAVKDYSEAGQLVKATVFAYTELGTPLMIKGLKLAKVTVPITYRNPFTGNMEKGYDNAFRYNHYDIRIGTTFKLREQQDILYDPGSTAKSNTTIKRYFYQGANHLFATKEEVVNDQGIYRTYYKYADDFVLTAPPADSYTAILSNLMARNYRGALIESYTSIQSAVTGSAESVVSGNILLYKQLPSTLIVVEKGLSLKQFPLTDYVPSKIILDATNKAELSYDTRYKVEQYIDKFDNLGRPIKMWGSDRVWRGTSWGYGGKLPVFNLVGAEMNEVVYEGFHQSWNSYGLNPHKWWHTETEVMYSPGRDGGNAIQFSHNMDFPFKYQSLHGSITKKTNLYHFSAWVKTTGEGSLILNLTDGTASMSTSLDYPNTNNNWMYVAKDFEISIPGPLVSLKMTTTNSVIAADDIVLVPKTASFNQMSYTTPYGLASSTDQNGKTTYFEYDELGRTTATRNHNKDLIATQAYTTPRVTGDWDANFSYESGFVNEAVYFHALLKFTDAQYYWIFDNDGVEVDGQAVQTRTYSQKGDYQVQLKIVRGGVIKYSPIKKISISFKPLEVRICAHGPVIYDVCLQEAISKETCDATLVSEHETIFRVTPSGGTGSYSYAWYIMYESDSSFKPIAGQSSSISHPSNVTFQIKCLVTDGAMNKGWSSIEGVQAVESIPGCVQQQQ